MLGLAVAGPETTKSTTAEKKSDKQKSAAVSKSTKKSAPEQSATTAELTGSRIKCSYRRSGQITDAPNQVRIFDRATIERSGAGDLNQFLNQNNLRR